MTAINDAFTYTVGDEVLREVGDRLKSQVGAHGSVARIGGDEFLLFVPTLQEAGQVAAVVARILEGLHLPMLIGRNTILTSACVGVARCSGSTIQASIRDAAAAMRQATALGPNNWGYLSLDVQSAAERQLVTQSGLISALELDQFQPWFMPVVALATGELHGYEALVRWFPADGGPIAPDKFLTVAARAGMLPDIDNLMMRKAVATLGTLPQHCHVAVNVSAETMAQPAFASSVIELLRASQLDPARLHLEVVESSFLQASSPLVEAMRTLAAAGCRWWADDFGTGFSSIEHLRDLPIHGIKLDVSFTRGLITPDDRSASFARSLAALADSLGLDTVAEGIEVPEQAEILRACGWRLGQGWLYGKAGPLPALAGERMQTP